MFQQHHVEIDELKNCPAKAQSRKENRWLTKIETPNRAGGLFAKVRQSR